MKLNLNNVKDVVTRVGGRGLLVTKKYSPQILTGLGIVAGVTGAVVGARATLQLQPILDEHNAHVDLLKTFREHPEKYTGTYDTKRYGRDLAFIYTKTGIKITKVYGPAISFGILSIGCIIGAQGIMQKREAGLMAAYTAVERSLNEYRKRVEAHVGPEVEQTLRYGVEEQRADDTKKGVSEKIEVATAHTQHSRFFDESSSAWDKTPEYNLVFLRGQQSMANDLLQARGHVFLNEVYDALGLPRSRAGSVVGWVLKPGNQNYIDFGIWNRNDERRRAFVNGDERSVLLDFNVDGVIFDQI